MLYKLKDVVQVLKNNDRKMKTLTNIISKILNLTLEDSHFSEVLKGGVVSFLIRILTITLSYIFILIVSRAYGAEAVGILSLCITFIGIATFISQFGFETSLVRFIAQFNATGKKDLIKECYFKSLKFVVPFSILITIFVFLLSDLLAIYLFKKPQLGKYFLLSSLAITPSVLIAINRGALRGLKKIRESSLFERGSDFFLGIIFLIGFLVLTPQKPIYPLISMIAGIYLSAIISQILWSKYLNSNPANKCLNSISYRQLLNISLSMLIISSMHFIMRWTDIVMLGIFCSEKEIGIYSVAIKIANTTTIMLIAVNSIAGPKFAELYTQNDTYNLKKVVHYSSKLIFWSSAPLLLIFLFLPQTVLDIFGPEFRKGAVALRILTIGQFVNSISGSVGYFLYMTGREKIFQVILFLAAFMNVTINYCLIPKYGIIGAALGTSISIIFWNVASVIYARISSGILTFYIPNFR